MNATLVRLGVKHLREKCVTHCTVGLLHTEIESKKVWDEFWKRQASSNEIIPKIIKWGRLYFSLIYVKFIKKHHVGTSILETGCGSAESTLKLANENRNIINVILLDFAFQSIRVARRNAKRYDVNANFIIGDVYLLPLKHETLEFVWNLGLLEHFEDPIPIIREMKRVTRKGGKLAGIVPFKYAPIIYLASILRPFTKITGGYKEFQTWEETKQLWSPSEYRQKFEMSGLKHVKVQLLPGTFLLNIGVVGVKSNDCNSFDSEAGG